jgi:hypothetical protein
VLFQTLTFRIAVRLLPVIVAQGSALLPETNQPGDRERIIAVVGSRKSACEFTTLEFGGSPIDSTQKSEYYQAA